MAGGAAGIDERLDVFVVGQRPGLGLASIGDAEARIARFTGVGASVGAGVNRAIFGRFTADEGPAAGHDDRNGEGEEGATSRTRKM